VVVPLGCLWSALQKEFLRYKPLKEKYTLTIHYDVQVASREEIEKTVDTFFDLHERQVLGLGWQPHKVELDNIAFPDDRSCLLYGPPVCEWHGIIKVKKPFDVTPRSVDFNSTEDLEKFLSNPYLRYRFRGFRANPRGCKFWLGWIPEGGTKFQRRGYMGWRLGTYLEEYYMGDVVPVDPSVWPGVPSPDGGHTTPLADREFFGMPPESVEGGSSSCGGGSVTEAEYSDLFGKAPGMLCHEQDGQCADPSRTERRIWPTQNADDWKGHGGKCGRYSDHNDYHKDNYVCCEHGVVSGLPGDWCKKLPDDHICKHDRQCVNGYCDSRNMCSGNLPEGAKCYGSNAECLGN